MVKTRALIMDPDTDGGMPVDCRLQSLPDGKVTIAWGGRKGVVVILKKEDLLRELGGDVAVNYASERPLS